MAASAKMFKSLPPAELILDLIQCKKKEKEHDRRILRTSSCVFPTTQSLFSSRAGRCRLGNTLEIKIEIEG